jgi:hypothetical protein
VPMLTVDGALRFVRRGADDFYHGGWNRRVVGIPWNNSEQFRTAFQRIMSRFFDLSNVRMLWPLRGRFYAARSNVPARSRRCTWSVPGLRPRLVLARSPTDAMSNEVTAAPKNSGDAVVEGHDRNRCAQLPGRTDYALALKGNQNTLHDDVVRFSR